MADALRLLYAEDDPNDCDLTRAQFSAHAPDVQLEIVTTGEACLTRLRQSSYDVLLLDNQLPDMDATELLRSLAAAVRWLPVVIATSSGDEELVVRLLRLGAWDYVPKNGNYLERLPAVVRNAVETYKRGRAGRAAHIPTRHVLYIEQHPADVDLTLRHLADEAPHLQVEVTGSSDEALVRLRAMAFDLVLCDLRMPDLSALDLLRELRHDGIDLPVVVISGRGDEAAAVAALTLGASDYIVKRDGYLTQLPYALDNAIDRHQLRRVNERLQHELADRERAEQERAHLSEQLQRAQKIESLGRLAGGVAHDFNNLLTVIAGHAELMLESLPRESPLRESARDISAASMRASELTRQLLAFSRRQVLQPRSLDLNESTRDAAKMLRRLLGEQIELVTVLEPELWSVQADRGQLDQVLVNLALNARDAMRHGGRLTIETQNVTIDEREAQRHPSFVAGSYVMLAVSDTGVGIPKEILPHIFEPFYTTKPAGQGTGLGLSMVYGIVKQSGGWVWVYSEPGQGTTVRIYLPRAEEAVPVAHAEAAVQSGTPPQGHELVLVVEDEGTVRKLTTRILRQQGYEVLEAANGQEALAVGARVTRIPLLMTDVVMPGMSGPSLAERLKPQHPEMKVLYTSGYTDGAVIDQGLEGQRVVFLQKPFTPAELARKVREALDA